MEDDAALLAATASGQAHNPFAPSPPPPPQQQLGPALLRALDSPTLSPKDAVALLLFALPLRGGMGAEGDGEGAGEAALSSSGLPYELRAAVRGSVVRKVVEAAGKGEVGQVRGEGGGREGRRGLGARVCVFLFVFVLFVGLVGGGRSNSINRPALRTFECNRHTSKCTHFIYTHMHTAAGPGMAPR